MKKNIVVIGGGNGTAIILSGLKAAADRLNLSAVVSMSDSGGSSGRLRKEFNTLPPGDIMRAVLALSKYDYSDLRRIFYAPRFKGLGKLDGHNLGNLFLVLAAHYSGDFLSGLQALSQSVEAVGKVLPVTLGSVDLVAELTNGKIIRTEAFIDNPQHSRRLKIRKIWLEPNCQVFSGAEQALLSADYIIFSPGSLYTSLVATILPEGVREAIADSEAKLIYVAGDAYRKDGETGPEKLSDFVRTLENYLPRKLNVVIYNNSKLTARQEGTYREKNWRVFEKDIENLPGYKLVGGNFEKLEGGLSPEKLAKSLRKLIV